MTLPLLIIICGLAFCVGFLVGSAVFARVLRQREQRVSRKIAALEYLRARKRIETSAVVDSLIDQERQKRAIQRPRWWRRLWKHEKHSVRQIRR